MCSIHDKIIDNSSSDETKCVLVENRTQWGYPRWNWVKHLTTDLEIDHITRDICCCQWKLILNLPNCHIDHRFHVKMYQYGPHFICTSSYKQIQGILFSPEKYWLRRLYFFKKYFIIWLIQSLVCICYDHREYYESRRWKAFLKSDKLCLCTVDEKSVFPEAIAFLACSMTLQSSL